MLQYNVADASAATCPQITSEQIVREAKELQERDFKAPTQIITNEAELGEYRLRKRKEYEDTLRMKRWNLNYWMKVGGFWNGTVCCWHHNSNWPCAW